MQLAYAVNSVGQLLHHNLGYFTFSTGQAVHVQHETTCGVWEEVLWVPVANEGVKCHCSEANESGPLLAYGSKKGFVTIIRLKNLETGMPVMAQAARDRGLQYSAAAHADADEDAGAEDPYI